jgi:hypothetical protein
VKVNKLALTGGKALLILTGNSGCNFYPYLVVLSKYLIDMRKIICFIGAAFFLTSCHYMGMNRVRGNGHASTQQRSISDFSGISLTGDMDVYFTSGPNFSVTVQGDQNLLEYVETERRGNTLEIGTREGYHLSSSSPIKIMITAPTLDELEVTGSGNFVAESKIASSKNLKIDVTGSGDVKIEVDAPQVEAGITGSGDVQVSGTTRMFDAEITGSGNMRCFDLLSESTRVENSGSGDAEVFASKQLDIEINGSGGLAYKGSPSVNQNISGSGSVRKVQ